MGRNNLLAIVMISLAILFCGSLGYPQAETGTEFVSFVDEALNQKLVSFISRETGIDQALIQVKDTQKLDEGFGSIFLKAVLQAEDGTEYVLGGIKVTDAPGSEWEFWLENTDLSGADSEY